MNDLSLTGAEGELVDMRKLAEITLKKKKERMSVEESMSRTNFETDFPLFTQRQNPTQRFERD